MGSNYGFKTAQPGLDVLTAADYQLITSSGWPLLKTVAEGIFDGSGQVTHGLGYHPMFLTFSTDGQYTWYGASVSTSVLYGNVGDYYRIFALPLRTSFTADVIRSIAQTAGALNRDWGIKVAKPGIDATANNRMLDYALNSNARSPMVHKVHNQTMTDDGTGGVFTIDVPHNLGYRPLCYCFLTQTDGVEYPVGRFGAHQGIAGAGGTKFTIDAAKASYTGDFFGRNGESDEFTLVFLKDPFTKSDNSYQVNY